MPTLRRCGRNWRAAVLGLLAALLLGCSAAGKWNDDPADWERAFGSTKPDAVVVVHSRYWRSPHWTMEFEYYFHVRPDDALRAQLFGENTLTELTDAAAREASTEFFGERPEWFLPGALADYAIFALTGQPDSNFHVFVQRESGDLFITDYQV